VHRPGGRAAHRALARGGYADPGRGILDAHDQAEHGVDAVERRAIRGGVPVDALDEQVAQAGKLAFDVVDLAAQLGRRTTQRVFQERDAVLDERGLVVRHCWLAVEK